MSHLVLLMAAHLVQQHEGLAVLLRLQTTRVQDLHQLRDRTVEHRVEHLLRVVTLAEWALQVRVPVLAEVAHYVLLEAVQFGA
jgi:hypothetical protein